MRKKIIDQHRRDASSSDQSWLDLERLAEVELTSEEAQHPIESALTSEGSRGWRAAHSGDASTRWSQKDRQAMTASQACTS